MADYIKLMRPMRLAEYGVAMRQYHWLPVVRPFEKWRGTRDEGSPWYKAYNAVKHDGETSFGLGILGHAIESVAAVHIMAIAQFGIGGLTRPEPFRFLESVDTPVWEPHEGYDLRNDLSPKHMFSSAEQ